MGNIKKEVIKKKEIKPNRFINFIKSHVVLSILIAISSVLLIFGAVVLVYVIHEKNSIKYCTVQFETNGGNRVDEQTIRCGEPITKPVSPTKEGFVFKYWELNGKEFSFNNLVQNNIVLNAVYEIEDGVETVTVFFDTSGAVTKDPITIKKGTLLEKPVDPILSGYKFIGWYKDYEEFNFEEPVEESMWLKARWEEIKKDIKEKEVKASGIRCRGSYRSDIPEMEVDVGYNNLISWIWATFSDWGGEGENPCYFKYSSSKPSVVSIDDGGNLVANKDGSATVSQCLYDSDTNKELGCFKGKIIVKKNVPISNNTDNNNSQQDDNNTTSQPYVPNKNTISTSVTTLNVNTGAEETFTVTGEPHGNEFPNTGISCHEINDNYDIAYVSYSTSYPIVVHVQGKNPGTTRVECENMYGGSAHSAFAYIDVNVLQTHIERIVVTRPAVYEYKKLIIGTTKQAYVETIPSNAYDKSATWTSSNPSVASVDNNGNVTALSVGTTTITVRMNDGGLSDSFEIEAIEYPTPTSVNIYDYPRKCVVGETYKLSAISIPYGLSSVYYESRNGRATVDNDGNVTILQKGSIIIWAHATDNPDAHDIFLCDATE